MNEMGNLKNSKKSNLRIIFLLLSIILVGWTFWPEKRTIERVPLKITGQDGLNIDKFQVINQLNDYQVVINYPASINVKEMEDIIIVLERTSQTEGVIDGSVNHSDVTLAIEFSIQIPNAEIRPAVEIIEPFIGQDSQIFIFNISAINSDDHLSGDVWVHMLIYGLEDQLIERFPLLVFPIQIRLLQILGLNPHIIKMLLASLFFILFLFFARSFPPTRMI